MKEICEIGANIPLTFPYLKHLQEITKTSSNKTAETFCERWK